MNYKNVLKNIQHIMVVKNIVNTPDYAKPFLKIMKANFIKNKVYFRKYIDDNKKFHGVTEKISYDAQTVTYDFVQLEQKYEEICKLCES